MKMSLVFCREKTFFKLLSGAAITCLLTWNAWAANRAAPSFIVNTDEAKAVYSSGRDIVFTVKPGPDTAQADLEKVGIKIIFNGNKELSPQKTVSAGMVSLRVKTGQPGWYRCDVAMPGANSRSAIFSAGAVVDPEKILPGASAPADLDAFWDAKKTKLKAAPLKFELKPIAVNQQQGGTKLNNSEYECFSLTIDVPVSGVRPVMGYFARPKNAAAGSRPAILFLRAAGVSGHWCVATPASAVGLTRKYGAIVLDINAHGIPNDMPKEYYQSLEKKELLNYPSQGKTDRDKFYFVGMYLRLIRSIDFLAAQKEWDGRHLVTIGESQGGGQALAAAGLDARVSAVSALVPALCDFSDVQVKRAAGWPNPIGSNPAKADPKVALAVGYCDNVFLASRSHAETQILVGLADTTCPAPGIFSTFNELKTPKHIVIYPHKKHNGLPREDAWLGEIGTLQESFIKKHLAK